MNTRILLVTSDDDYAVVDCENEIAKGNTSLQELWKRSYYDFGGASVDYEKEEVYFKYKAYLFGSIDSKFIGLIKNEVMDYDNSKNTNFFVVGEVHIDEEKE